MEDVPDAIDVFMQFPPNFNSSLAPLPDKRDEVDIVRFFPPSTTHIRKIDLEIQDSEPVTFPVQWELLREQVTVCLTEMHVAQNEIRRLRMNEAEFRNELKMQSLLHHEFEKESRGSMKSLWDSTEYNMEELYRRVHNLSIDHNVLQSKVTADNCMFREELKTFVGRSEMENVRQNLQEVKGFVEGETMSRTISDLGVSEQLKRLSASLDAIMCEHTSIDALTKQLGHRLAEESEARTAGNFRQDGAISVLKVEMKEQQKRQNETLATLSQLLHRFTGDLNDEKIDREKTVANLLPIHGKEELGSKYDGFLEILRCKLSLQPCVES